MKIQASISNSFLNININGIIESNYTASIVKYHVDDALAQGVTSAVVNINSEGGSVFEAQQIVNELKRIKNVKCTVGAVAASAATYIICFFDTECYETSQFMIHKPMTVVRGNEDQVKSDTKLLENLTNNFRSTYATKLNKTEAEIEDLWKNDYWFDAKEALELGFVSAVINDEIWVDDDLVARLTACGCPTIPQKNKNFKPENKMSHFKVIALALGKSAEIDEAAVLTAVNELKAEVVTANASATEWENKYKNLQKTQAESLVDKAVELGLINEALKTAQVNDLLSNFEEKQPVFAQLISEAEENEAKETRTGTVEAVVRTANKKSGEQEQNFDWLQKNNPVALAKIRTENPAKYAELAKEYANGVRAK